MAVRKKRASKRKRTKALRAPRLAPFSSRLSGKDNLSLFAVPGGIPGKAGRTPRNRHGGNYSNSKIGESLNSVGRLAGTGSLHAMQGFFDGLMKANLDNTRTNADALANIHGVKREVDNLADRYTRETMVLNADFVNVKQETEQSTRTVNLVADSLENAQSEIQSLQEAHRGTKSELSSIHASVADLQDRTVPPPSESTTAESVNRQSANPRVESDVEIRDSIQSVSERLDGFGESMQGMRSQIEDGVLSGIQEITQNLTNRDVGYEGQLHDMRAEMKSQFENQTKLISKNAGNVGEIRVKLAPGGRTNENLKLINQNLQKNNAFMQTLSSDMASNSELQRKTHAELRAKAESAMGTFTDTMDVVMANIRELGNNVGVDPDPGQGFEEIKDMLGEVAGFLNDTTASATASQVTIQELSKATNDLLTGMNRNLHAVTEVVNDNRNLLKGYTETAGDRHGAMTGAIDAMERNNLTRHGEIVQGGQQVEINNEARQADLVERVNLVGATSLFGIQVTNNSAAELIRQFEAGMAKMQSGRETSDEKLASFREGIGAVLNRIQVEMRSNVTIPIDNIRKKVEFFERQNRGKAPMGTEEPPEVDGEALVSGNVDLPGEPGPSRGAKRQRWYKVV